MSLEMYMMAQFLMCIAFLIILIVVYLGIVIALPA